MLQVFSFRNYKDLVLARLSKMPKKGHGEFLKIARELKTHSTRISHVFKGSIHLTLEQACSLCRYLGLNQIETEYFLALVQFERAGTRELKKAIEYQLDSIRARSNQISSIVKKDRTLPEVDRAIFYSDWLYSGIRLLAGIKGYQTPDEIANYFKISRHRVMEVIRFLISKGLCVEDNGKIKMGPKSTHTEASSRFARNHHINWRLKALKQLEASDTNERNLNYTCPACISKKDFESVRSQLIQLIGNFSKITTDSEPEEELACLTIDWFQV